MDFENNLLKNDKDPSKTSKLFVQVTDDLSYARTFYKNRSVRLYLNGIAKLLFNDLNKPERKGMEAFVRFWKTDLPLTVFEARRALLVSALVFVVCFVIGAVTCRIDPEFAASILSDNYVQMTKENISKGDPMAVYKSDKEMDTFLPILLNNLRVDFLTFFSGILMAIGSLVIMIYNGVMVGVFQYFFIERGLFVESFLTIWTHGALEISAMILSGAAGLTLGKGLVFPGTYTRWQAFKISGMNGLKIILAVTPMTLLAAFIEGFITRHTDIPNLVRLVFILLCFFLVFLYFVYYPRKVAKAQGASEVRDNNLVFKQDIAFEAHQIHSLGTILANSFRLFFKHFAYLSRFLFVPAVVFALLAALNPLELIRKPERIEYYPGQYFQFNEYPATAFFTLVCFSISAVYITSFVRRQLVPDEILNTDHKFSLRSFITYLIAFLSLCLIIYTDVDFSVTISLVLFPFMVMMGCISELDRRHLGESLQSLPSYLSQSWFRFIISSIVWILIALLLNATVLFGLRTLYLQDAIIWMLTNDETTAENISVGTHAFLNMFGFTVYLILSLISNSILFFTLKESLTAGHLRQRIQSIEFRKK